MIKLLFLWKDDHYKMSKSDNYAPSTCPTLVKTEFSHLRKRNTGYVLEYSKFRRLHVENKDTTAVTTWIGLLFGDDCLFSVPVSQKHMIYTCLHIILVGRKVKGILVGRKVKGRYWWVGRTRIYWWVGRSRVYWWVERSRVYWWVGSSRVYWWVGRSKVYWWIWSWSYKAL